ncbi:hypothetical protein Q8F55_006071 [Vanrija albida]|uniref:Uncharacterized protein n=1 Tax=Vanrija albida TaxID=181172 RepID=A0ABR3Q3A9_9TREE
MDIVERISATWSDWFLHFSLWAAFGPKGVEQLNEAIGRTALCLRENAGLMAIPGAAACVTEMLETLGPHPMRGLRAAKRISTNTIPGAMELLTARSLRLIYGLDANARFVSADHDPDAAMRTLLALRQRMLAAGPTPSLLDRFNTEGNILELHASIDAAAQLECDGVLDGLALFPEKAVARTHEDVKHEVAECVRSCRARWEKSLRGMSAADKRVARREYLRQNAAAEERGEGPLVEWRREQRAAMLGEGPTDGSCN